MNKAMNRPAGIHHWPAKRAFLRAVYDAASDKALVLSVIDTWVVKHDKEDFRDKCYDTFRRWGHNRPTGPRSLNFWKWIIENHGLRAKMRQLWSCSIVDFVGFFPPAEADVALAVAQLVGDQDAQLDAQTQEELRKRFVKGTVPDGMGDGAVIPEYSVGCSESLRFTGTRTGIRRGHIEHKEFYMEPEAAAAWTALIDTEHYRMYLDCLLSLKELVDSETWLKAIQDGRHHAAVILGGGGSPEKDWAVASSLLRATPELDFVLTDISFYMINESAKVLCRRLRKNKLVDRVHATYKVCDFLVLEDQFCRRDGWQSVVWTLLGGTIGNVPKERDFFRSIKGPSRVGDLMVLGIDTVDTASEEELANRMSAEYRSKEVDAFLLNPIPDRMRGEATHEPGPVVNVTVGGDCHGNSYSDVPNARTAIFSTPLLWNGQEEETVLTTSTRYVAEDFIAYARRFGWIHLETAKASPESTFHQLLLERVE